MSDEIDDKKIAEKVRDLVRKISSYPVETTWDEKEKAKRDLIRLYNKSTTKIRGFIIFHLHEKMSKVKRFRDFITVADIKRNSNGPINIGLELTEIFDYPSSIDGIIDFMDVIKRIDDILVLKLLSYHISRYMFIPPNNASKVLLSRSIEILGESKNPYALQIIIDTFPSVGDRMDITPAYVEAAKKWMSKVKDIDMPKDMRNRYVKKLKEILKGMNAEGSQPINYYA